MNRWTISIMVALMAQCILVLGCTAGGDDGAKAAQAAQAVAQKQEGTPAQETATQEATEATQQEAARMANPLLNPASEQMKQQAPAVFKARFETTKGPFVVEVTREWSPNGADRFYNLVKGGYFNECRFFRCVKDFMVQWGLNGDPAVNAAWRSATIPDDPVKQKNARGFITYAKSSQPNSRTTQVFINFKDNSFLDTQGFSPFGKVVEGMEVVDKLYSEYGDAAPAGKGPQQGLIHTQGNVYLDANFPNLDHIKTATIVEG